MEQRNTEYADDPTSKTYFKRSHNKPSDSEHLPKRHRPESENNQMNNEAWPPDVYKEQLTSDAPTFNYTKPFNAQGDSLDFTSDDVVCGNTTEAFSLMGGCENPSNNINELERLKEFQVLDEVGCEDGDDDNACSDVSEDVGDDEIERMLEEGLPDNFKGPPKEKEKPYITRHKLLIEEKGTNHFEVLPLDWLVVMHNSGIPVYLHKTSRVCTLAKPYFLGKGSVRKHEIPISAIPCLNYRRALDEEEKRKDINNKTAQRFDDKVIGVNTEPNGCPVTNHIDDNHKTEIQIEEKLEETNIISVENNAIVLNDSPSSVVKNCKENVASPVQDNNKETRVVDAIEGEIMEVDSSAVNEDSKSGFEKAFNGSDKGNNENNLLSSTQRDNLATTNEISSDTTKVELVDVPASMQPVVLPGGLVLPPARIETVQENWKSQHLSHEEVTDYCRRLFKFKTVSFIHFKHWADRRKYTKAKKAMQRPTLPEGTKLISIPVQQSAQSDVPGILGRPKHAQLEWIMNMNGRSYVSVFNEYVRRALQKQPLYEFRQLENAQTPYEVTVLMDGMQYGVGRGSSKRQAKSNAARESILILIPEMREQIGKEEQGNKIDGGEPDLAFFDMVGIEDPRIMSFCTTTMEPSPHAILRTCLLRNFGTGDRHIQTEMKKLKHEKIEFQMSVGKHKATVLCKNKKIGKQRASQAILQALHPHIKSWGSLLRLYGSRSIKSGRDRKLEEQEITLLQDKATVNQPNYAILDKLKQEMDRLNCRDTAVVSIGTLLVHDHLPTLSGSGLNNIEM